MSSQSFKFKQFEVFHNRCAMKVGTDGVLLGAWVARQFTNMQPQNILDIGTGSGLIALMLAQQFKEAEIIGIDIDDSAIEQATFNFAQSAWSKRLTAKKTDFTTFMPQRQFELIVSNPPYFSRSLKNPDQQRALARHNDSLPYKDLVRHTMKDLLSDNGVFAIIIPYEQEETILDISSDYNITDICHIRTYIAKPYKRTIIALTNSNIQDKHISELTLEDPDHSRSREYAELTTAYYL